ITKSIIFAQYADGQIIEPESGYPSKVGHSMPSAHACPLLRSAFPFLLSNLRRVAGLHAKALTSNLFFKY
ncbi:MAG: hypothetical protein KDD10_14380, partial [Phaeodactylibacter sp.]|nr:hypothetical protein [Phaeodactylibacter sp.]